jgi:hypothetical protein
VWAWKRPFWGAIWGLGGRWHFSGFLLNGRRARIDPVTSGYYDDARSRSPTEASETTMDLYSHLFPNLQVEMAALIDAGFRELNAPAASVTQEDGH